MVCFRYIIVNTLYERENYHNNNNNNNSIKFIFINVPIQKLDGQLQKQHNIEKQITKSNIQDAGPSGRAV
jgi:hypothetical protein